MSIFNRRKSNQNTDDENLVMLSLGGDRDAFCEIVVRYQNLLCSLAYSSVGNLKWSEDIAQETFVEAWKKLDTLREPAKLKSWLCGILRFKASHYRRKEQNQPAKSETEVEDHHLPESHVEHMEGRVIEQEQQELLWKVLNSMEAHYREPLVLFYRQQQSVETVANELDLTVDTAKQRLSRGRKILKQAMAEFVEDTLSRSLSKSKPGAGFTAAVLLAINTISPPAKAAAVGATAVKGGSLFKFTTLLTLVASLSGLVSSFFGTKAALAQSRTEREKRAVIQVVSWYVGSALVFVVAMFGLQFWAVELTPVPQAVVAFVAQGLVIGFAVLYMYLLIFMTQTLRDIRAQERIFHPEAFHRESDKKDSKQREVISAWRLFGVPLYHFQFGMTEHGDKPAFAWIAGGNYAYGLLFAWGGFAAAPVSVGIVAVGVVSIGAVSIGVLGLGTVAIGFIGFGASAVAYKGYGSLSALGWESAFSGGFSAAVEGAMGTIAHAKVVNNEAAASLADLDLFSISYQWALATIAVFVIVPAIWHARKVKQRMT